LVTSFSLFFAIDVKLASNMVKSKNEELLKENEHLSKENLKLKRKLDKLQEPTAQPNK